MIERTCENGHGVQISGQAIEELQKEFGLDASALAEKCPECGGRLLQRVAGLNRRAKHVGAMAKFALGAASLAMLVGGVAISIRDPGPAIGAALIGWAFGWGARMLLT